VIAGGGADVIVDWMPSALATREKGVPLVNIAQPFKKSGMMLTCRKDTRHQDAGRLQGQDARRLVLRQRISVPVLDERS
jgi:NitT/TauT family transport system substrate-binding protein